jgi:hypothetical protein
VAIFERQDMRYFSHSKHASKFAGNFMIFLQSRRYFDPIGRYKVSARSDTQAGEVLGNNRLIVDTDVTIQYTDDTDILIMS